MAKTEDVGLIEKHVEKAVLAASVALFAIVFFVWVWSSPREVQFVAAPAINLPRKTLPPSEVDEAVRLMAQRMKDEIERADIPNVDVPPYEKDINERFLSPVPVQVGPYPPITSGRPPLEVGPTPSREKLTLASLLPVPAPRQPKATVRIEVLAVPQANAFVPRESAVSHIAVVYDFGQVIEKWREAMKNARMVRAHFTIAAIEVERQVRGPDGSWGPPVVVSPVRYPATPEIPPLPKPTAENVQEVREAIGRLSEYDVQRQIIEPGSYDVYDQDNRISSWIVGKPRTVVSDLEAVPTMPGLMQPHGTEVPPVWRPGVETPPVRRPGVETPPIRRPGVETPPIRRPAPGAPTPRPAPGAPTPRPAPGAPTPRPAPGAPTPRPAGPEGVPAAPHVEEGAPAGPTNRVPTLNQQLANPAGIMEVWAHEADLLEGVAYRYRVRLVLINPLFGEPNEVANEADAQKLTIETDWSAWSEPVETRRPLEFFISGRGMNSLFVTVFTRKWNTTVGGQFRVTEGSPVGKPFEVPLTRPDGQVERVMVDFGTGAVVVDMDFAKKVRIPNLPTPRETVEIVCLGADGRLISRTEMEDAASKRFRELKQTAEARGQIFAEGR